MYSQPKRIEFLDSIRGLAALFVLLSHTMSAFQWPVSYFGVSKSPFISILFNGKEAVAMFFVLSGYVLSKPYLETGSAPARKIFLPTFYLRRFIRIWPPWFFAFGLSIFARKYFFVEKTTQPEVSIWLRGIWQVDLTVLDFFRQCAFVLHDPARQLLNQDWSLGVELKGSALIPLFVVIARPKYVWLMVPLAAIFLVCVDTGEYYVSFIIGVLVAQYGTRWSIWNARLGWAGWLAFFLSGLLLYQGFELFYRFFNAAPLAYKYGWVVTAVGCGLILISVFGSQALQRMLNSGAFVFIGRISYSVYLLQFIIILCLLPPLVALLNRLGIVSPWALFPITIIASVAATIGGAALMYRFIESPVISFSHLLTKKLQKKFQK
jgi:peptidoglycan/LPS O-acetylase OafA/YrhL